MQFSVGDRLTRDQWRDIQEVLWKECKEHFPSLIKMVKFFTGRTDDKYDNHVAVEGVTGGGKSMLVFIFMLLIMRMNNRVFNPSKQILFIPDEGELRKNVESLKEGDSYWIDEAIRALDKQRWYDQDQIEMNHIVNTERWKRNTIFYCMPSFRDFNKNFRTKNIYYRIYIIPRYSAVLNVKDIDKDVDDPWNTKINLAIKFSKKTKWGTFVTRYKAFMGQDERTTKERKLPNYVMDSPWLNLEDHPVLKMAWEEYGFLKMESRRIKAEKDREKEDKSGRNKYDQQHKIKLAKAIHKIKTEEDITYKKAFERVGLSWDSERAVKVALWEVRREATNGT